MYFPEVIWDTSLTGMGKNLGPTMDDCWEQGSMMEEITGSMELADAGIEKVWMNEGTGVVYDLQGDTGWAMICADSKQNLPNKKFHSKLACTSCAIHSNSQRLELIWLFAQDLEPLDKSKWNTVFRLKVTFRDFGLPFKIPMFQVGIVR